MTAPRRRRAGSVRFDAYYKVQWWAATSLSWRDVQRRFDTADDAEAWARGNVPGALEGQPVTAARIMRIAVDGRAPVNTLDVSPTGETDPQGDRP